MLVVSDRHHDGLVHALRHCAGHSLLPAGPPLLLADAGKTVQQLRRQGGPVKSSRRWSTDNRSPEVTGGRRRSAEVAEGHLMSTLWWHGFGAWCRSRQRPVVRLPCRALRDGPAPPGMGGVFGRTCFSLLPDLRGR